MPVVHAQNIRLGEYKETAVPKHVQISSGQHWKKNCSRNAWYVFKKRGLGWDVKLSTFEYLSADGDIIPISYISPYDFFEYLMKNHPGVLVGGLQSATDRAEHLAAFWEGFRLQHKDHMVFEEHNSNLSTVVPIMWHGDEGRGKRRGNTAVVSMECVLGTDTAVRSRKRSLASCSCKSEASHLLKRRFGGATQRLSQKHLETLRLQTTTMKGHSLLHHWPLFIIPSSIHHAHPQAMIELLELIAKDFKRLFFEGCTISGKTYNAAVVGAKGDLKWFGKIALQRSWENQGRRRDLECCHLCMGGGPQVPWEDVVSDAAAWHGTRYSQRPWVDSPCVLGIPVCRLIPEKQFLSDPFHCTKVGIYRDVVGSIVCWLVSKGYFGQQGNFDEKLSTAHMGFVLYCRTVGRSPALRTFSRRLFMYPRFDKYPWSNTKGSDTMLLLDWLVVQLTGFQNDPQDASHLPTLQLMKAVCKEARQVFTLLNGHGLWVFRGCSMNLFSSMQGFIRGYVALANSLLNDVFNGFGIKPKLHLLRHTTLEMDEALQAGDECLLSFNSQNCESNEDLIGRTCRLSRRLDSRKIGQRVLGCTLLKSSILYNRFKKVNRL